MQKNSLASKVALVTGAARRIGAEIARTLHENGMNIVIHYNTSEEAAFELVTALNKQRQNSAIAIRAQLDDMESLKSLIQQAVADFQRLDVVVNNASRFYRTLMGEVTDLVWEDLLNSNLKAPFFLSQAAMPYLKETKGMIINITDIYGVRPLKDYPVYCISKGALEIATKVLARELGPEIRVNAIAPGSIIWPEGVNSLSQEEKENIINSTSLMRSGEAQDIAKAALFFVRDAPYVTGQILMIDGGKILG